MSINLLHDFKVFWIRRKRVLSDSSIIPSAKWISLAACIHWSPSNRYIVLQSMLAMINLHLDCSNHEHCSYDNTNQCRYLYLVSAFVIFAWKCRILIANHLIRLCSANIINIKSLLFKALWFSQFQAITCCC